MEYFSDVERGKLPRITNDISHDVWCGLVSYINTLLEKGWFANDFPEMCPDGQGCCGTDKKLFAPALRAEVFGVDWPLITEKEEASDNWSYVNNPYVPGYMDILDLVQFCFAHVAKPEQGDFHSYWGHRHLPSFDQENGRSEFVDKILTFK